MRRNGLLSMLAGASLIGGCATDRVNKQEEISYSFRGLSELSPKSKEELEVAKKMLLADHGPMYNIIEYKNGNYNGYKIETFVRESKLKHEIWRGEKKSRILRVFDYRGDRMIARIEAFDSDAEGEEPFAVYSQSCIIPQGHPFESYTPEKLREIYNSIAANQENK